MPLSRLPLSPPCMTAFTGVSQVFSSSMPPIPVDELDGIRSSTNFWTMAATSRICEPYFLQRHSSKLDSSPPQNSAFSIRKTIPYLRTLTIIFASALVLRRTLPSSLHSRGLRTWMSLWTARRKHRRELYAVSTQSHLPLQLP